MKTRVISSILTCFCFGLILNAGEKIDSEINWKIRREETERSQVMRIVHFLTDVYGPRVTGSPNFKEAGRWALEEMQKWGMQSEHAENWAFSHAGWACEKSSVRVLSPYKSTLNVRVVAWTPSTKGLVRAGAAQITPPEKPTLDELTTYLNGVKDKLSGRIVMVGAHTAIPIDFNAPNKRRDESELRTQFDPANPAPSPQRPPEAPANQPKRLAPREIDETIDSFLLSAGALVKVTDAARNHGQIRVTANRTYDCSKAVPSIVVRNEDYGRLARVLADGTPVEMEVEIVNNVYPEGQIAMNFIAEIPGGDKKDEVVMMGAHIDSWHGGTGATDNASGVAVMMEAARILQTVGIKPRRTIRIALWGGEEEGLLGSQVYVRDHFGTFESPGPEYSGLSAYINLDSGTGRVRGASVFGPPEAAAVLREILEPFKDLGVVGANSVRARRHGGTDSTSFNWAGLAGINLLQDPIEYSSHTWHTDLDTYERVFEPDLKQCAIVVACAAYHLAVRDELLPRFKDADMPSPEK
jgi:carboxypeptidase Q